MTRNDNITLNLLGKMTVLPDCINNNRVLLALLLEKVAGCDFWQAQYISKICVLVAGKFGDVTLGDRELFVLTRLQAKL